jgi:hypothetical protein
MEHNICSPIIVFVLLYILCGFPRVFKIKSCSLFHLFDVLPTEKISYRSGGMNEFKRNLGPAIGECFGGGGGGEGIKRRLQLVFHLKVSGRQSNIILPKY